MHCLEPWEAASRIALRSGKQQSAQKMGSTWQAVCTKKHVYGIHVPGRWTKSKVHAKLNTGWAQAHTTAAGTRPNECGPPYISRNHNESLTSRCFRRSEQLHKTIQYDRIHSDAKDLKYRELARDHLTQLKSVRARKSERWMCNPLISPNLLVP